MTVAEARIQAHTLLSSSRAVQELSPSRDILIILSSLMGQSTASLLAHPETPLGPHEQDFFKAIALRQKGMPVAYITGTKEFWGLPFKVNPSVLIPKPDTETLVERAISIISAYKATTEKVRVLDVCTGSGCVAIALKHSCPNIEITATDISTAALEVARENAATLLDSNFMNDINPIRFAESDLRSGFTDFMPFHLIVSNPPYVPSKVARNLLLDGRNEPLLALDGGIDGLDLVRALTQNATSALVSGGTLLIETGEYNAKAAADYVTKSGFVDIVIHTDIEGQDRVIEGRLK